MRTLAGIVILFVATASCLAQDRAVPFRARCVDLILLKDGTRLLGTVLPGQPTRILLRSAWVTANCPDLLAEASDAPEPSATDAWREVLDQEIVRLQATTPEDLQRIGLVREARDRLTSGQESETPWLIIGIPDERIRRLETQSPRARQSGFLGILNQVDGVEEHSLKDVEDALNRIPASSRVLQLPAETSAMIPQDRLACLLAAIDVRTDRSLAFIQTGTAMIPDDPRAAEAMLGQILSTALQQQMQQLLQEALQGVGNSGASNSGLPELLQLPEAARTLALQRQRNTVQVTAFATDLTRGSAVVRRTLFTRVDKTWKKVLEVRTAASASEVSDEDLQPLATDPRIREITELFSGLGSGTADLNQALRLGAVVRLASNRCEDELQTQLTQLLNGQIAGEATPAPRTMSLRVKDEE